VVRNEELPSGVVELGAAHYGARQLRLLGHSRAGSSGVMPVEAINAVFTGSPHGGSCLVVDALGEVRAELRNDNQWLDWRRNTPLTGAETLKWLAGLRPRKANVCLWTARSSREER
jgi:hypothetical protein